VTNNLREQLADAEHASWSSWMTYLFSKCEIDNQGCALIPAWAVERWKRQAATEYADLSEKEKESDRHQVDKILPIIVGRDR